MPPNWPSSRPRKRLSRNTSASNCSQLRDDILGDAIVAAYRPGPPGKPDEEQGILLLRARNATLLASLIDRFNEAQKKSGDLIKLEEREYQGVKYYLRVDARTRSRIIIGWTAPCWRSPVRSRCFARSSSETSRHLP